VSGLGPSFMKIWTCGSSPRSGSRNAWTRIKNVNGASRLSNFWNFFCAILMISCQAQLVTIDETWLYHYDPETKQQSMEWQHSGSLCPKNSECRNSLQKFSPRFWGDQEGILLIDYLPKGQTINAEYYSSLLVQLKDILKGKRRGKDTKGVLFLHDNAPAHRTLATQNKLASLGPVSWSPTLFSGSVPIGLPPVPWTEKTMERSPFFVRRGGHCCRGDLVGWTTFWILFEWLAKVRAKG